MTEKVDKEEAGVLILIGLAIVGTLTALWLCFKDVIYKK